MQTQIQWSEFKKFIIDTDLYNFLNFLKLDSTDYYVWFTYQGMTFYTMIMHGTTDYIDFTNNFKSKALLKNDISNDGYVETKVHKVAKGTYLQDVFVQVRTATKDLVDKTGAFSVKLLDSHGAVTEDSNIAVKTVIRFAPRYTYQIYAGGVESLEDITEDVWIDTIIAPDIPRSVGGKVVNIVNRQLVKPHEKYVVFGTGPVMLPYNPLPSAPFQINIIDTILSHGAGYKLKVQIQLQTYA